jgi:anthranilate synthase component 2
MILVLDNYDSFTWNLVHYLMELGAEVQVVRNDALTARDAIASNAQAFLISPGPCTPNEAGISLDLVAACAEPASRCSACASAISRSASISAARSCAAG